MVIKDLLKFNPNYDLIISNPPASIIKQDSRVRIRCKVMNNQFFEVEKLFEVANFPLSRQEI